MAIMVGRGLHEWSLTEAARLLGEPQHRLIYLCEKGVVQPDLQDAEGRGSSRRFSGRNLLEFGVALRLRALGIPASVIRAALHVLRRFEREVARQAPGFTLPGGLVGAKAPELKILIGDDRRLYFTLSVSGSRTKTYGGIPLQDLAEPEAGGGTSGGGKRRLRAVGSEVEKPATRARVEVSVTGIAQDLRLEA